MRVPIRFMRTVLLTVAVLSPLAATPAAAQVRDTLATGTRVRVWLAPHEGEAAHSVEKQRLRGTLTAFSPDSLTLRIHPDAEPVSLAWQAVDRLDRSRGVPTRFESALRQGFSTAALGALEFVLLEAISSDRVFGSTGEAALMGAVTGAAVGVVLGALHPRERWARVRAALP